MSMKVNKNGKEYPLGFVPQGLYDDVEDLKNKTKTTPIVYSSRALSVNGGYVTKGNVTYVNMSFTVASGYTISAFDTMRLFDNFPKPEVDALMMCMGNGANIEQRVDFFVRASDGSGALINRENATVTVSGVTYKVNGCYINA